jgi:uncharacterized protein
MRPPNSLSLDTVLDEPVPFSFELFFSIEGIDREPLLEISPVRLEGEVARVEKDFLFDARLAYRGRLECSRCLASYPFEVREDFSLVLKKRSAAGRPDAAPSDEDMDAYFYEEPVLPVAPIAEERIQMAVPMKPLCREDCRGLCPRCGQDWNLADCPCAVESTDPRWEALRQLKKV